MRLGIGLGLTPGFFATSGSLPMTNLVSQYDPANATGSGWPDSVGTNTLGVSAAGITTATDLAGKKVVVLPGTAHYVLTTFAGLSGSVTVATVVKTSAAGPKAFVTLTDRAFNDAGFGVNTGKDTVIDPFTQETNGTVTINDGTWRFMLFSEKGASSSGNRELYVGGATTADISGATVSNPGGQLYIGGDPDIGSDVAASIGMTLIYAADYTGAGNLSARQAIYAYFRSLYNNLV